MPAWVDKGVAEYARRRPRELSGAGLAIPPATRGSATPAQDREQEAEAIEARLKVKAYVVALDIAGKAVSTELIAERFVQWQMQGDQVSILIGGPDGLHPQILKSAKERWSLGQITLPHPLVRVILAEQLYRAWSVQAGHPYHRGN